VSTNIRKSPQHEILQKSVSKIVFPAERQMGRHDMTSSCFLQLLCELADEACWTTHMACAVLYTWPMKVKWNTDTTPTFGFRADAQNPCHSVQTKYRSNTIGITTNKHTLLGWIHKAEHEHTIQIASTVLYATSGIQVQDTLNITVCLIVEPILLLQLWNTNTICRTEQRFRK
jgi:hypothetical protein